MSTVNVVSCKIKNLWKHIDYQKSVKQDLSETELDRLDKLEDETDNFFCSAVKTQQHYMDLFTRAGGFAVAAVQDEIETSAQLARVKYLIPEGKIWKQAIIFPPERIPVHLPVPDYPEVYQRVQWMDPEDFGCIRFPSFHAIIPCYEYYLDYLPLSDRSDPCLCSRPLAEDERKPFASDL